MRATSRNKVFYHKEAGRLVYIGTAATSEYWDDSWIKEATHLKKKDTFVLRITRKYLDPPASVLDAGCGQAHTVYSLHHAGYTASGIDWAPKTVAFINQTAPELNVSICDVRKLEAFADGSLDGVWSLGVIEHFEEGFDVILAEMNRVTRIGGYAFVTVPSLSPLRKMKAEMGRYPIFCGDYTNFYQFVYAPSFLVKEFKKHGYDLAAAKPRGGLKGFKDEVVFLSKPLQMLFDNPSKLAKALKLLLEIVLNPISYHTRLYVFKKTAAG